MLASLFLVEEKIKSKILKTEKAFILKAFFVLYRFINFEPDF